MTRARTLEVRLAPEDNQQLARLCGALDANLRQAELAYTRQRQMLAEDATSRAEFETAEATLKAARSQVSANTAQVRKAAVAVESAELLGPRKRFLCFAQRCALVRGLF